MPEHSDAAAEAGPRINPGLVLLLCSGATFMAFLDLSVVNIAFPQIVKHFPNTTLPTMSWVVSGYSVMFAALLTPLGRLADTAGRTRVFLWCLVAFTVVSAACGAATDPAWLITARFVQGAAAAGMIPAALGLVMTSTPPQNLMKAIGAWSAAAGFSAVIGPVIGGLLVDSMSWRSVFYINVPVGVLLLAGCLRALPRHQPPSGAKHPDLVGTVLLTVGIGTLVAGLTEGSTWGWSDVKTIVMLVAGVVFLGGAIARSRGQESPAVDTGLWRSRRFAVTNAVSSVFGVSMFAWLLSGPLWTAEIWHWSIMQTAGALSVGAVASMITSTIAGRISDQRAMRGVAVLGLLMFAGCTVIQFSPLFDSHPRFWAAWVPSGLIGGGGLGLTATALSSIAATSLPPMRFAAGVGMNLTARQLGGAIGTAGFAAIMAGYAHPGVTAFHHVYIACTIASVAAALIAVVLPAPSAPPAAAGGAGASAPAADSVATSAPAA